MYVEMCIGRRRALWSLLEFVIGSLLARRVREGDPDSLGSFAETIVFITLMGTRVLLT